MDISLNHDVAASFSLHKWPWVPRSGANLAAVTVYRCKHIALRQHTNCSITLYMSIMDVWSSLRWISASTMTIWHLFHSTSDPDFPDLGPIWLVWQCEGATIFPWDSIPMAQSLCISMSNMDVWSSLRRILASTMMLWHHFHSTCYPEFPNLGQTWLVWQYKKDATIFLWDSILMAQTLYMSIMDVWSSLRRILASTMTLWHHFHSTRYPDFPHLGQTWLE